MRRAPIALAGTVAGLVALLGYKSSGPAIHRTSLATNTPPATDAPADTTDPTASSLPGPPRTGVVPTTTTLGPLTGTRSITGPAVPTRYGDVQVRITIVNGKLTDVVALQLPHDRSRSQMISDEAGPMLHDEAIAAGSANIDTVGGATYTSDGYAQSLQAALDLARQ